MKMMTFKRKVSAFLALVVTIAGMGTMSVQSDSWTPDIDYYSYSFETDSITANYFLSLPIGNDSATYSFIPPVDSRVEYANSGVVKLSCGGTGFVVGDHTIATAAHCVYERKIDGVNERFLTNIDIDLYDDERNYVDTISAKEAHIPELYTTCAYTQRHSYDYALITVSEDLSDYEHFRLGELLDTADTAAVPMSICGFPSNLYNDNGELTVNTDGNLYIGNGVIQSFSTYRVDYTADASGGNSGGPAFVTTTYQTGTDEPIEVKTVFAIHTAGATYNGGVRITSELMQFYLNNPFNTYEE